MGGRRAVRVVLVLAAVLGGAPACSRTFHGSVAQPNPLVQPTETLRDSEQVVIVTGDMDLNLPRLPGTEILRRVRDEESLCRMCVIVLATSDAERDVIESERLSADGYITKPISLDELSFHYYRLLASR